MILVLAYEERGGEAAEKVAKTLREELWQEIWRVYLGEASRWY